MFIIYLLIFYLNISKECITIFEDKIFIKHFISVSFSICLIRGIFFFLQSVGAVIKFMSIIKMGFHLRGVAKKNLVFI